MHKLFHRFSRKDNVKVLRRELAFAHTCIALLSVGMIALLSVFSDRLDSFNQILTIVTNILLGLVAVISISIVVYILKTKK